MSVHPFVVRVPEAIKNPKGTKCVAYKSDKMCTLCFMQPIKYDPLISAQPMFFTSCPFRKITERKKS